MHQPKELESLLTIVIIISQIRILFFSYIFPSPSNYALHLIIFIMIGKMFILYIYIHIFQVMIIFCTIKNRPRMESV